MRLAFAAFAASLALTAPAVAQVDGFGPDLLVGPATVLVPYSVEAPRVRYTRRTVLVRRVVYVPHRVVSRRRYLDVVRTGPLLVYPAYGAGYPGHWHYGATYVPPGAAYGCTLGVVGCDSSFVGSVGD